jgi:succinyl-diaminopimelate desuccinylase
MAGIKAVYKVKPKPIGIGGGTVAAIFRREGYHAAVWAKIFESAHQPNEYALISNIIGDAKVFAHVCLNG